eukprot:tig00001057_g6691.t1
MIAVLRAPGADGLGGVWILDKRAAGFGFSLATKMLFATRRSAAAEPATTARACSLRAQLLARSAAVYALLMRRVVSEEYAASLRRPEAAAAAPRPLGTLPFASGAASFCPGGPPRPPARAPPPPSVSDIFFRLLGVRRQPASRPSADGPGVPASKARGRRRSSSEPPSIGRLEADAALEVGGCFGAAGASDRENALKQRRESEVRVPPAPSAGALGRAGAEAEATAPPLAPPLPLNFPHVPPVPLNVPLLA